MSDFQPWTQTLTAFSRGWHRFELKLSTTILCLYSTDGLESIKRVMVSRLSLHYLSSCSLRVAFGMHRHFIDFISWNPKFLFPNKKQIFYKSSINKFSQFVTKMYLLPCAVPMQNWIQIIPNIFLLQNASTKIPLRISTKTQFFFPSNRYFEIQNINAIVHRIGRVNCVCAHRNHVKII